MTGSNRSDSFANSIFVQAIPGQRPTGYEVVAELPASPKIEYK